MTTTALPPEPEETAEDASPINPTFGEAYVWENGLAVTLSLGEPFTPSEFSAFEEAPAYLTSM